MNNMSGGSGNLVLMNRIKELEAKNKELETQIESLNSKFPAPDYKNAVTIKTNNYIPTKDGYVALDVTRSGSGVTYPSNTLTGSISINGVRVFYYTNTAINNVYIFPAIRSGPIPVKVGDNVVFSYSSEAVTRVFYPVRM